MSKAVISLSLKLFIVCLIAAVGLGFTYTVVEDRIAEQEVKKRSQAAGEVLAPLGARPEEDAELASGLQADFPDLIGAFRTKDDAGEMAGYAFVLKSKGYNFLTMAVGVDTDGRVSGIEVIVNEETPGLGKPIAEDPGFLGQFQGRGPQEVVLNQDVDAVTSATYTSRGIAGGVNMALEIWRSLR